MHYALIMAEKRPRESEEGGSAKRVAGAVKKFINIRDVIENWSKGTITDTPVSGDDMYCEDPDPISFEPFQVGDNVIMQNKTKHCFKEIGMQKWLQRKQVNPLTNMPLSQEEIKFVGIDKTPSRVAITIRRRDLFGFKDMGRMYIDNWAFDDERMNQSIIDYAQLFVNEDMDWVSANDIWVQQQHTFSQYREYTMYPGVYVINRGHQRTFCIHIVIYTRNKKTLTITPHWIPKNQRTEDLKSFNITLDMCKQPPSVKRLTSRFMPHQWLEENGDFAAPNGMRYHRNVLNYHKDWDRMPTTESRQWGTWFGPFSPELSLQESIANVKTGEIGDEQIDLETFSQKVKTTPFRAFLKAKHPKDGSEKTRKCFMDWYEVEMNYIGHTFTIQLEDYSGNTLFPENI